MLCHQQPEQSWPLCQQDREWHPHRHHYPSSPARPPGVSLSAFLDASHSFSHSCSAVPFSPVQAHQVEPTQGRGLLEARGHLPPVGGRSEIAVRLPEV